MREPTYPAWLITLCVVAFTTVLHYGYVPFPPEDRAQVWNVLGSAARLELLALAVYLLHPTRAGLRRYALAVVAAVWYVAEEAMVIGCSVAYIVRPWEVLAGQDQCSSLLHFDIAKIGALAAAVLLVLILFSVFSNWIFICSSNGKDRSVRAESRHHRSASPRRSAIDRLSAKPRTARYRSHRSRAPFRSWRGNPT